MIKRRVQFDWKIYRDKRMPVWAYNFLSSSGITQYLELIKKKCRKKYLPLLVKKLGKSNILEHIYCNQSGDVVFYWQNKEDMAKFVKTWRDA
jgi:hypothetical protein